MTQREWADEDYYADLGVSKPASLDEIKKAYRRLARENHPGKNSGNKAAEDKFKRISEAYSVVGDEDKRRERDEPCAALAGGFRFPGAAGAGGVGAAGARGFDFDVSDPFGEGAEFGGSADGAGGLGDFLGDFVNRNGGAGTAGRQKAHRGTDVETEITLDFHEAAQGVTISLQLTSPPPCMNCNDPDAAPGISPVTCTACHSSGYVKEQKGAFGFPSPCAGCGGQDTRIENPCSQCNGTGMTTRRRTITVCVPAGVMDSRKVRLAGQGEAGLRGHPAGDLFVTVHAHPDEVFTRSGNDLEVTVLVSFGELALGGTITVSTLGDKIRVRVPAGTANGRTLRVCGRGIPKRNGAPGDLLVTMCVKMSTNLDDNATSALCSYVEVERASGFNPREGWAGAR